MMMRDAVICSPLRTPVGRFGGVFKDVSVTDLGGAVIKALLERNNLDPAEIDDVIFGQGYPSGEAPALGRVAPLQAGLPTSIPGVQLDRRCGSGLQAICYGSMMVQTGAADLVIAGGAESMSNVEYYSTQMRWGPNSDALTMYDRLTRARVTAGSDCHPVPGGMIETAENLRKEYSIPREEQDALALRSHQRAVAAWDSGKFDNEIVPISVPQRRGDPVLVTRDEHPRADTTMEALSGLRAIYGRNDPESTVTAGNSSGQNDAASACIITTMEKAQELGLKPLGRILGWAVAGVPPRTMGIGPVHASQKVFDRLGMSISDMEIVELNEAFAAQVLAVTREWKFTESDFDRLNPNGSGISIGHPIGATGGRILATLLNEMERRDAQLALETMCIGGGQGISAVIERVKA